MSKPRLDANAEHRTRELRKIANGLQDLANEIATEEQNLKSLHPRRAMMGNRQNRCQRQASSLLMDTLAFDGPEDEQLRIIICSWRDKPGARDRCFEHVCEVWRPLLESRIAIAKGNLTDCARALRLIASGVASIHP